MKKQKKKVVVADFAKLITKTNLPENINFDEGSIILINKPLEWTSFDIVNKVKYCIKHNTDFKKIKVGHAGTLDPMADGLLIVCTGKYTKLLEGLSGNIKSYKAIIKLGCTTPSFDRESAEENFKDFSHVDQIQLDETKNHFVGLIDQKPPIFSAIKIKGQTAYKIARRGEDIEMQSRQVEVSKFEFTDVSLPLVSFDVTVSKGTYIRSLANDFGALLNCGAYLAGLTRTSIADYQLNDALEIDDFVNYVKENSLKTKTEMPL